MTLSVCDITVVEIWPTLLSNTDPPQHFNGLRSGLWLGHYTNFILFFFSHRCADSQLLLGSLSCCIAQLFPSFSCQTASCLALQYFSIQTGSGPVVQSDVLCKSWSNVSPLVNFLLQKSCGLLRSGLVMFSLERRDFLSQSVWTVMNLNTAEIVVLFSVGFPSFSQSDLGLGRSLLGRPASVFNVVNPHSYCRPIKFRQFGNRHSWVDEQQQLALIIWIIAPNQQTAKTPAFIEAAWLIDDQLIQRISLLAHGSTLWLRFC